jgi:GDP-L-fucose synthase
MVEDFVNLRIAVTGGTGFLGTAVVAALQQRGCHQIYPLSSNCDLTNWVQTYQLFSELKPDLVIHLAARVGGIGANRDSPGTFFRDNMLMGLHVLEAARQFGTRKVVVAGTVCAYPKFTPVPFQEDNLWNGYPEETNAPYGIAKKSLLVMAQAYRQEFGSNFVMLFPANLYGPRDNFDLQTSHVIPAMIQKLFFAHRTQQPTVELWGDGSPTREFLYVDDAARGFVQAAEHYDGAEPINLGTGQEIRMRELAQKIANTIGYRGTIIWNTSYPNGQPRRSLDVSQAKKHLGFEATTPLEAGLARTLNWYRSQYVINL